MKGSVVQKKSNGKYYPVIYDKETKRHKWGKGFKTVTEAETELRKLLNDYDRGKIRYGKNETFESVYNDWLDMVAPELYKSVQQMKTTQGYIRKHVMPVFKDIEIDQIDAKAIQRMFYKLKVDKWVNDPKNERKKICVKQPASPATKRKIIAPLNSIFKSAKSWGLIDSNPCDDIQLQSPEIQKKEVWNSSDIAYFFSLPDVMDSVYYLPFLILATTGMRRSEVCGLTWSDYHDTYVILTQGKDVYGNETDMKSAGSHRRIDLMELTTTAIEHQKERQKHIGQTIVTAPNICKYIVTDKYNKPINPKLITDNFKSMIIRNNKNNTRQLPIIPLKNLRHSFATMMIYEEEINIKIVSEVLGHARTSTTQNFYQASAMSMHGAAVSKLENMIFKKSLEEPLENNKKASN